MFLGVLVRVLSERFNLGNVLPWMWAVPMGGQGRGAETGSK